MTIKLIDGLDWTKFFDPVRESDFGPDWNMVRSMILWLMMRPTVTRFLLKIKENNCRTFSMKKICILEHIWLEQISCGQVDSHTFFLIDWSLSNSQIQIGSWCLKTTVFERVQLYYEEIMTIRDDWFCSHLPPSRNRQTFSLPNHWKRIRALETTKMISIRIRERLLPVPRDLSTLEHT